MTEPVKGHAERDTTRGRARRGALISLLLPALALAAGCGDRERKPVPAGSGSVAVVGRVATLWAERDGRTYWNREPITSEELRDSLAALHGRRDVALWYARARPDSAPTAAQLAVVRAVIDARLSVRMVEPGRPELPMMMPDTTR